eukprot:GHVH01012230.1.p1 GENE.GHVH01012230.1~~GHVH01012230.1.p1  ORF type:complete len:313 (+),score=46.89 GHVH01012230.1:53-940(+)
MNAKDGHDTVDSCESLLNKLDNQYRDIHAELICRCRSLEEQNKRLRSENLSAIVRIAELQKEIRSDQKGDTDDQVDQKASLLAQGDDIATELSLTVEEVFKQLFDVHEIEMWMITERCNEDGLSGAQMRQVIHGLKTTEIPPEDWFHVYFCLTSNNQHSISAVLSGIRTGNFQECRDNHVLFWGPSAREWISDHLWLPVEAFVLSKRGIARLFRFHQDSVLNQINYVQKNTSMDLLLYNMSTKLINDDQVGPVSFCARSQHPVLIEACNKFYDDMCNRVTQLGFKACDGVRRLAL